MSANVSAFQTDDPVTIGSSDTVILTQPLTGQWLCNVEVENIAAGVAFTDFKVQVQDHPGGEWYDYLAAAEFATISDRMLFAKPTGLNTLASGSFGHLSVNLFGAYAVRFLAKCATSTTAKVRGTVS